MNMSMLSQYSPSMADREETMDVAAVRDSASKSGRASLLDSGEDFELLDEEYIDDDLPPLEDAGGGKMQEAERETEQTDTEASGPEEEWLDVLGT